MLDANRTALMEIYQAALQAVNGRNVVAEHLRKKSLDGSVRMVAVEKAAQSMAEGAWDVLGEQISLVLVISKSGHLDLPACTRGGWEAIEDGLPLPSQGSLRAGERLLEFIQQDAACLLFLISGGASSLVECPVERVDRDFLIRANNWLLGSGLAIDEMNRVRKGLSRIKGGGLLQWLGDSEICALAISDVPGDDPAIIGSGLLVPDAGLRADLQRLELQGEPGVTIWGGETTVKLPPKPGRGGRNQHLALAAAEVLHGRESVWLLAAGTDGPTEDAGALVDGATIERAEVEELDAEQMLAHADAGRLLESTGDLLTSCPSGTNVMDLMIGLKG